MESSTAPKRGVDAATIAEAFRITSAQRAGDVAIRTKGDEVSWTWGELRERVDALAGGLHGLGLRKGDTIALMLGNRPEFHLADLAAIMVGATPFSIYMTYAPNQIEYVVSDAGARILITEQQFLDNVLEARKSLPDLEHVIVVDGDAPEGTTALADVAPGDFDVDASVAALAPDDVLTLIYTSGTTGPPKGVELAHRNLLAAVSGIEEIVEFPEGARVISWLPNAHIAERAAHHYLPIVFGFQVTCCPNPREIIAFLPEVRPHWFFAVPRIWEKLKAGLEAMVASQPEEQREKAQAALGAARQKVALEQAGEPVPEELAAAVATADAEMFAGLRTMLGLDQVVAINVGAAPTPVEVLEFFHAIGLPLAELWGMSETCGGGAVNPPDAIKIGTVGPATPGCELKTAEDGELLIRGGLVMLGYRGLPDKTAETIDADGWLHTGDIAQIDEDGYVKIVDRKKEIIINAAGKNIPPAMVENRLKSQTPIIGHVAAIGDRRSYLTALVVLDEEGVAAFAARQEVPLAELARDEAVLAEVAR
ncbi:MAG: long-chain fatty acid--CoA ligase, partial [Conexibacter sp.]|nr:long-chain fatty acid--CoA ligase [Conexibacter sp.]